MTLRIALAVVLCALMVGGCRNSVEGNQREHVASWVERVVDEEAGVVCWIYTTYSIDCLPLSETRLVP